MNERTNDAALQVQDDSLHVLIAGAGPTGLMLACELARRGVSFQLIESAAGPQPGSRGKGIQPRTLEVFDDLGIVDRVIANGQMSMPMRSTGPDGQVKMAGTDTPVATPDIPYPVTLITPEWRIEEALRARLAELGGAVEFGTALESFTQTDESVTAQVTKEGKVETVTARWLVGCDGGHSVVRKQAGITFKGETRDEIRMIVADVEVDGLDRDAWHIWVSAEGMISLCPLPSTNTFQLQSGVAPGQDAELTLANMQATLERRSGRTDIRLHEPVWSSLWRCNVRLVDRYREGRVFLAGDAAHIHSPAGGQGMNTGIQDAHNLGWKLAAVVNGASPALLDSYEAERLPVAAGVLALSNERLKQVIETKNLPTNRTATTTQLGISYRGSTLARDDRDESAAVRAGDRAPDASGLMTVGGKRRWFDLTRGGRFTLLNFGGTSVAVDLPSGGKTFHVVQKAVGADDVVDTAGLLASAFGAKERTLVLIRPDGYIGAISDEGDVEIVVKYLKMLVEPVEL